MGAGALASPLQAKSPQLRFRLVCRVTVALNTPQRPPPREAHYRITMRSSTFDHVPSGGEG